MWSFWLAVAGFFFFIEITTVGFLTLWFGIGALVAMIVSFFIDSLIVQTSIFIVISTTLLLLTKTLLKKFFSVSDSTNEPNQFSVVGKTGVVTTDIDTSSGKGQVKIEGSIWSAKTNSEAIIPVGSEVVIEKIEGVKVIVHPTKIVSTSNN